MPANNSRMRRHPWAAPGGGVAVAIDIENPIVDLSMSFSRGRR